MQINKDIYPQHNPLSWLADSSRKSSASRVNARRLYKRDTGRGHILKETNKPLPNLPALWRSLLTGQEAYSVAKPLDVSITL